MLGPPKPHRLDEPIAVSQEALYPADHFCRYSETKLCDLYRKLTAL